MHVLEWAKKTLQEPICAVSITPNQQELWVRLMKSRRREERVQVTLPIRVWGMDANHRPFTQRAVTLDITRTGIRVGGLQCQLQTGEVVGLQHGTEKARFRVAWVGRRGGSEQGQAGLSCVEKGKDLWGEPFQQLAARAPVNPPVLPRTSIATAQPAPAAPVSAAKVPSTNGNNRRTASRFPCTGGAEMINSGDGTKSWGTVSDLSTGGCYVELPVPPNPGTSVQMVLTLLGADLQCTAEVRTSDPSVGMGIAFVDMSAEDQHRLEDVLRRIAAGIDIPLQNATLAASECPDPAPAHPRSATIAASLSKISKELRSIDSGISSGALSLDSRVMGEFHRTLDHARQNAWSVQQWVQSGVTANDSYKLLAELDVQRIRGITQALRDLAMDVEAGAVNLCTDGVADLISAVAQLNRRLAALTQNTRA